MSVVLTSGRGVIALMKLISGSEHAQARRCSDAFGKQAPAVVSPE